MRMLPCVIGALMMMSCAVRESRAETLGHVVIQGKDRQRVEREASLTEAAVRSWTGGAVLFTERKVSRRYFLCKTFRADIVFAGPEHDVSEFLETSPFEGGVMGDVSMQVEYDSGRYLDKLVDSKTVEAFPSVRAALHAIAGGTEKGIWQYLKSRNGVEYAKHAGTGQLWYPRVRVEMLGSSDQTEEPVFRITRGATFGLSARIVSVANW